MGHTHVQGGVGNSAHIALADGSGVCRPGCHNAGVGPRDMPNAPTRRMFFLAFFPSGSHLLTLGSGTNPAAGPRREHEHWAGKRPLPRHTPYNTLSEKRSQHLNCGTKPKL